MKNSFSRRIVLGTAVLAIVGSGVLLGANQYGKPKSIIHVVTLYYRDGVTAADKKKVLDGVEKMASAIPGIKNVWLRSVKVQGDAGGQQLTDAFVMEFADEAAFKAYDNHPAHREWEKIYVPLRGESRTHDITN
ncbi:MAG: Dabb family protein [Acidobacteria bacterium]|nr:Dabb family protein [Acidobacteriota bacterium]